MKFKNAKDETQFRILRLDETEVRKRLGLVSKKKDHKKSREMKNRWRRDKNSMKKGMNKWHKSTKGKRFHKALGRFNALRETAGYQYYYMNDWEGEVQEGSQNISMQKVNDALLGLSSIETHLYLELQFYESDPEAMKEFLEIVNMFLEDSIIVKESLIKAYTTGVIPSDDYLLLNDIIQFFQDPKMYVYAKRELADLSNDSDTLEFKEQVIAAESVDFAQPGNVIYDNLDKLFVELIK